jgi:hypothetical protein
MRALFFGLILANLLFYGWHTGYFGPGEEKAGEPERLAQQIAPNKIHLVVNDPAKPVSAPAKPQGACIEWGSFPTQEADRAQAALVSLNLGDRLSSRKVEESAQWWVFMPPQGNKANADKKADELTRRGVTDYFIVTDEGPNKFAISLGVFSTEDAARNYLAAVNARGVKTAKVGARDTKVQKTIFQIRGADDALLARLAAIKKDFAGIDTRPCVAADAAARSTS